jgi:hypothetical protein
MGIALSWVAVSALSVEETLLRLSLTNTGTDCRYPFKGIASHTLQNDWFLIAAQGCEHRIVKAASMSALSQGCIAVACVIEEHVNYAATEFWKDGERMWRIQHQGDEDSENIAFQGQVPQRFHELLATVEQEDSENPDSHFHMDIPLVLAKELCGFRHDESNASFDSTPFKELAELKAKGSWWKLRK